MNNPMKKVVDIDVHAHPEMHDLHRIISLAVDKDIPKAINISPLSYDSLMKRIEDGKLSLTDMNTAMKISNSKFFHFYDESTRETIIQISSDKVAVFSDTNN